MAINKEDLSYKKLINKEFTDDARNFFQESTVSTFDINSEEVYTDVITSDTASMISDGVVRQLTQFILTPDPTYTTSAWYVLSGSGFTPGVDGYTGNTDKIQRNFVSDKYGANYEVKLYDNGGSQIFKTDAINWYFDYKTGILHVADPGAYTTPYKVSVLQYVGLNLSASLSSLDNTISSGAASKWTGSNPISRQSDVEITGSLSITDDLVVFGSASFNYFHTIYQTSSVIYASGSTKFGDTADDTHQITGSLLVSGSITGLPNVVNNLTASYALTASYVATNPLKYYSEPSNIPIYGSPYIATTDQTGSIAIGDGAVASGSYAISIGSRAGVSSSHPDGGIRAINIGDQAGAQPGFQSFDRIAIGQKAGAKVEVGNYQILIGIEAGLSSSYSNYSVFVGDRAGQSAVTSSYSVGVGRQALYGNSKTNYAVAVGNAAGWGISNAEFITAVGNQALYQATRSPNATALGTFAGYEATNATSSIYIGNRAGLGVHSSSYSIFVGYSTAFNRNNLGSNLIIVGPNASLPSGSSAAFNIGNVLYGIGIQTGSNNPTPNDSPTLNGKVGIGIVTPTSGTLHVNGNVFATSFTGSLFGTASHVDLVAGPNITINKVGTTFQISGSGGGGGTFPYTGDAQINGSLGVTGSVSNLLELTNLDNLSSNAFQHTGEVIQVANLDGSVVLYDAVALGTDNVWRQATATTEASSSGLLGICIDTSNNYILLEGMLTCDNAGQGSNIGPIVYGSLGAPGVPVYLRTSTGNLTTDAPVAGTVSRIVGYLAHQNQSIVDDYILKFKPSTEWFTIA